MRCFRVDERSVAGIPLTPTEKGGLQVDLGDQVYSLQADMEKRLLGAVRAAINRLREAQASPREAEIVRRASRDWPKLLYADVASGMLVSERSRSKDALVLVETCAGQSGSVDYKSTIYEEEYDRRRGRVERVYRGTFPTAGIEILAEGRDRNGARCMLLRMKPNSSFRIERSGALEGESPVLTVIWTGGRSRRRGEDVALPLLVVPPRRFQS